MRDGLRGASVRAVLAESGLTSGAMRYYFGNHDELLMFAAEHVLRQAEARIRAHLADDRLVGRDRVRAILGEILPLDETRATEITVFVRLAELDDADGRGSQARASAYHGCRALVDSAVAEFERTYAGEVRTPGRERHHLVEHYHLALDGLAYQYVLNPGLLTFQEVAARLDRLLDSLEADVRTLTRQPGDRGGSSGTNSAA